MRSGVRIPHGAPEFPQVRHRVGSGLFLLSQPISQRCPNVISMPHLFPPMPMRITVRMRLRGVGVASGNLYLLMNNQIQKWVSINTDKQFAHRRIWPCRRNNKLLKTLGHEMAKYRRRGRRAPSQEAWPQGCGSTRENPHGAGQGLSLVRSER